MAAEIKLKYFDLSEFDCHHTGKNEMDKDFLLRLDALRDACGFPFKITSGYRDKTHPIERVKATPGMHSLGIAVDIFAPDGITKRKIVQNAIELGFNGIGVGKSFIHVDTRKDYPVIWGYGAK